MAAVAANSWNMIVGEGVVPLEDDVRRQELVLTVVRLGERFRGERFGKFRWKISDEIFVKFSKLVERLDSLLRNKS